MGDEDVKRYYLAHREELRRAEVRLQLIAVRDPYGIRALCYGRLGSSWVVASETCALNTIGAEVLRKTLSQQVASLIAQMTGIGI